MRSKLAIFIALFLSIACQQTFEEPIISLDDYHIEEGFTLEVIASEPFLEAPVIMDFDIYGRLWVAEMRGYMRDADGSSEEEPTGLISILEDRDKDGVMDHSIIFLDHLVMPRALALVYGGLLYVESPNLWFVEIIDDKPGKKTLVDDKYAVGGNPEHQPNGLMMNIDNWIYNAKSNARYQLKDGKWIKESTTTRGQWGISKDNFGRLYVNNNSTILIGDDVLPNLLIRNKSFKPNNGLHRTLDKNQKVYPLMANPVNRGYIPGVLDEEDKLIRATSACGPMVYRGGGFSDEYDQNVFVCLPEANLIKRSILSFNGDHVAAQQAWDNKEFLASTDDTFRPVNLLNGPDGAMYILDMHRGVIQHIAFLSPYLREEIEKRKLNDILGMGRILRVKREDQVLDAIPDFDHLSATELAELLKHKNGWIRDKAQHYLVYLQQKDAIQKLEELLLDTSDPIAQIHAMHTLGSFEANSFNKLMTVAQTSKADVCAHALVQLEKFAAEDKTAQIVALTKQLMSKEDLTIDLYLSITLGTWSNFSQKAFFPLLLDLSKKYVDNPIFQDAILSGLAKEEKLFTDLAERNGGIDDYLAEQIAKTIDNRIQGKENPIFTPILTFDGARTKGMRLYKSICSACHGINGLGVDGLAPPLMKSEYVTGNVERLGLVVLHGLHGPIHVRGERYELNTAMPGLLHNPDMSDKDIAAIISFVTSSFSGKPRGIKAEKLKELRNKTPKEAAGYTEEELSKVKCL